MRGRHWTAVALLVAGSLACSPQGPTPERSEALAPPAGGPASANPSALALADSVVAALGGWEGWNDARYLEFTFSVSVAGEERRRTSHRWDRFTGQCRIDGEAGEGKSFVGIWNQQSGDGQAWLDGQLLAGKEAHEHLERAKAMAINDGYWLLMPFKLHDPGVHLQDAGATTDSLGKEWRVLALTFDPDVGLTPGDRYWVRVDPATGLVGGWEYVLESFEPGAPPSLFSWEDWQAAGPIRLSLRKQSADRRVTIQFDDVAAGPSPPEGAFVFGAGS